MARHVRKAARHPTPPRRRSAAGPPADAKVVEAKLFMNGRSQAVRLPADCRFDGDAVYVKRWRNTVTLLPKGDPWRPLLESLGTFSDDFMRERTQPRTVDRRPEF